MSSKKIINKKLFFLALIVSLLSVLSISRIQTFSADIVNRTITLGSSFPSENTTHEYEFTTVDANFVGSVVFQYCSNSPLFTEPCTPPAGLDVSGASIDVQSGLSGFSVSGVSTNTNLVITRAPAAAVPVTANFVFGNIINPSTPNEVNYVRVYVYNGPDGTGTALDQGAVVYVVDDRYDITAYVPPYLTFCVGVTVALNCSNTTGFLADFGEFSELTTSTSTSQFSAATNDPDGYNVFINGQTMTSGANIIPGLTSQGPSQIGVSQFGLNLRANSVPSVGSNPESGPVSNGTPALNYNSPNLFRFVNGDRIAGSPVSTGFNRYTASYIVNVSENQNPGVYAATLTYTAIASF